MANEKFFSIGDLKVSFNDTAGSARNTIQLDPGSGKGIFLLKLEGSADAAGDLDIYAGVRGAPGSGDTLVTGTQDSDIGAGIAEQHGAIVDTITGADSPTIPIASAAGWVVDTISPGDLVTNTTDSSTATVISVTSNIQLETTALAGGGDNVYQSGDSITITPGGVTLIDTSETFVTDGVGIGDIIENTSDGSDAVITDVTETIITCDGLSGGTGDTFDNGDNYTISSLIYLDDSGESFLTDDIEIGDIVTNTVTANEGVIVAIVSDTRIQVASIVGWMNNTDTYTIKSSKTFTQVGGKTIAAVALLNEDLLLPIADAFKFVLTDGGRMSITYMERG